MTSPRWNIDEFGKDSVSEINIEPGLDEKIINHLIKRGHKVNQLKDLQIAMDLYQQLLILQKVG